MNVLLLGEKSLNLRKVIESTNDKCYHTNDAVTPEFIISNSIEFIVSYGYRKIIQENILAILTNRVINLHISYLPWNRGADPNFWSIVENTKRGVTIHLVDKGIDTGDIIIQQEDGLNDEDTLRTSYEKLTSMVEELFSETWANIRICSIEPIQQMGEGSYHRSDEKNKYLKYLHSGWDTPVSDLLGIMKLAEHKQFTRGCKNV